MQQVTNDLGAVHVGRAHDVDRDEGEAHVVSEWRKQRRVADARVQKGRRIERRGAAPSTLRKVAGSGVPTTETRRAARDSFCGRHPPRRLALTASHEHAVQAVASVIFANAGAGSFSERVREDNVIFLFGAFVALRPSESHVPHLATIERVHGPSAVLAPDSKRHGETKKLLGVTPILAAGDDRRGNGLVGAPVHADFELP